MECSHLTRTPTAERALARKAPALLLRRPVAPTCVSGPTQFPVRYPMLCRAAAGSSGGEPEPRAGVPAAPGGRRRGAAVLVASGGEGRHARAGGVAPRARGLLRASAPQPLRAALHHQPPGPAQVRAPARRRESPPAPLPPALLCCGGIIKSGLARESSGESAPFTLRCSHHQPPTGAAGGYCLLRAFRCSPVCMCEVTTAWTRTPMRLPASCVLPPKISDTDSVRRVLYPYVGQVY